MMSWPSTVTVPLDGLTMPQMMLISVVLPAPFGPSNAKISPCGISRLMSFSAWKPPAYFLLRWETEMAGGMRWLGVVAGLDPVTQLNFWRKKDGLPDQVRQ